MYLRCLPVLFPQSFGIPSSFAVPVALKKSISHIPFSLGCSNSNMWKSSLSWQILLGTRTSTVSSQLLTFSEIPSSPPGFTNRVILCIVDSPHEQGTVGSKRRKVYKCKRILYKQTTNSTLSVFYKIHHREDHPLH